MHAPGPTNTLPLPYQAEGYISVEYGKSSVTMRRTSASPSPGGSAPSVRAFVNIYDGGDI